jgi:hypothetical protein
MPGRGAEVAEALVKLADTPTAAMAQIRRLRRRTGVGRLDWGDPDIAIVLRHRARAERRRRLLGNDAADGTL